MVQQFEQIRNLIEGNRLEEASALLTVALNADDRQAELYFLQGQIAMKHAKWGSAINDFHRVLEINPHYPGVHSRIEMAQSILGFFNPDLLNP